MKKKIIAWFLLFAMMIALVPAGSVQAATYKKGSGGNQVRNLQRNLSFLGYSVGTIDGKFGNNTKNGVKNLQKDLYFEQTGIVDQNLNNLIKGTVMDIQSYLKEKGYYTGEIDGIAGTGTKNSLKKYQKEEGYSQTGIVSDLLLWDMLNDPATKMEMNDLVYWVLRTRNGGDENRDKEYLSLFRQFPFCLNNEMFNNTLGNYVSVADDVLKKNDKDTVFGAILTGLSEGKDIIWNELIAKFNNSTKTYKEQMRLDAISCLMRDVCENENLLTVVAEEVGDKIGTLKSGYNWNKKQDREALAKEVSGITAGLSIDEVEKIFELIDEDETVKEAFDNLDTGIKITEYAVGVIQLYQIEVTTLERLQDLLPEDSDMYKDLEFLKQERSRNEVQYILETIMASEVKDMLLDALESQLLPFPASVIMTGAELSISIFANHIYTGALSEDLIQTYLLRSYVNTLKSAVLDMNTNFMMAVNQNKKLPTAEQMEDYEFVYTAYLAAVKNYLICAENIADKYNAPLISAGLKEYDTLFTYQNYIKLCLKQLEEYRTSTVTNRMDYLLDQLGADNNHVVYFTVSQNECYSYREPSHRCANCNIENIVKETWFKEIFGEVNPKNFPKQDVDAASRKNLGYSCFGFVCFAQYYIYQNNLNQKVASERVADGNFTKSFVQNNVEPGDVLRLKDKEGYHSVLVYSIEDDHIVVLDSNWSKNSQGGTGLNCTVQKHTIKYTGYYSGAVTYVNRVTNASE